MGDLSWSAIQIAGGWAETSGRLSKEERAELVRLGNKSRNTPTPLTTGERAKYVSLVTKAMGIDRIRRLPGPSEPTRSPREPHDLDAGQRLERAAELRDRGVISEEDFQELKARYLPEL